MSLRDVLKVGDEVIVDVVDSEGVSIGDVLDFYRQEFVVTIGRKYITTEHYGKTYKYDIETGLEVADSLEKRRFFITYNQLVASRYYGKIQRELSQFYVGTTVDQINPQWYPILQELKTISEPTIL